MIFNGLFQCKLLNLGCQCIVRSKLKSDRKVSLLQHLAPSRLILDLGSFQIFPCCINTVKPNHVSTFKT